jgi:hypothetical protein
MTLVMGVAFQGFSRWNLHLAFLEGVTLHGAQAVSRRKTSCFLAAKLDF